MIRVFNPSSAMPSPHLSLIALLHSSAKVLEGLMHLICHPRPAEGGLASRPHTNSPLELHSQWLIDCPESVGAYWLFYVTSQAVTRTSHFLLEIPSSLTSPTAHLLVLLLPLRLPSLVVFFKNTSFHSCLLKVDFFFLPSAFFPLKHFISCKPRPPLPLPQPEPMYRGLPQLCL